MAVQTGRDHDPGARAAGPPAMVAVPLAVVIGLGGVWILDGLEVTMVGNVAARLTEPGSGIELTAGQIGIAAAIYIAGACLGALVLRPAHRPVRPQEAVHHSHWRSIWWPPSRPAFAFAPWCFFVFRFFTGAGIGGEYAAINSAIDELIPARVPRAGRPHHQRLATGSARPAARCWRAAAAEHVDLPADLGWRLAFGIGAVLRPGDPGRPPQRARRARDGCSSTDARRRPNGSSPRSNKRWSAETGRTAVGAGGSHSPSTSARRSRSARSPRSHSRATQARDSRPGAVHRAGVPLQRLHLQPRHAAGRILRRGIGHGAAVLRRVGVEQLRRPAAARATVRHGRPQGDDLVGPISGSAAVAVRARPCSLPPRPAGSWIFIAVLSRRASSWRRQGPARRT